MAFLCIGSWLSPTGLMLPVVGLGNSRNMSKAMCVPAFCLRVICHRCDCECWLVENGTPGGAIGRRRPRRGVADLECTKLKVDCLLRRVRRHVSLNVEPCRRQQFESVDDVVGIAVSGANVQIGGWKRRA